ncbi:MAG: PP2C family protein-serine/threonine phosphatase [Spirochaetia bacterium]
MGSSLWYVAPRIAVLIAGLLTYRVLRGVGAERSASVPAVALCVLLIRDLSYIVYPHRALLVLVDILVLLLYLYWLEIVLGRREAGRLFLAVVVFLSAGAGILDLNFEVTFARVYYAVAFAAAFLLFATTFYDATTDEVVISRTVQDTRDVVFFGMLYPQVLIFIFGHNASVSQAFFYPALYIVHIAVLLFYFRRSYLAGLETAKRAEEEKERLYGFMHRVESAIGSQAELDRILGYIVEDAVSETGANGGAVFLIAHDTSELYLRALYGTFPPPYPVSAVVKERAARLENYFRSTPIQMGATVIGTTAASALPTFIPNADEDPRLHANHDPADSCYIRSLIAVPLIISQKVLGVVAIVRTRQFRPFEERDFRHLQTFADYAALSIDMTLAYLELLEKKEIESELNIAAEIQKNLLPDSPPKIAGLVCAMFSSAARGVGGDLYEYSQTDKHTARLMICDVAGKGIPAALVMVMINTLLDSEPGTKPDPALTLRAVNVGITRRTAAEHYATIGLCRINVVSGELEYANAAHHPLMVYRKAMAAGAGSAPDPAPDPAGRQAGQDAPCAGGRIEYLDTEGLPIGVDADGEYHSIKTRLSPGDVLVLYTDGITEAPNTAGEQFGAERLATIVVNTAHQGAEAVRQAVCTSLEEFVVAGKQHDDQTLLVLEFAPGKDDT